VQLLPVQLTGEDDEPAKPMMLGHSIGNESRLYPASMLHRCSACSGCWGRPYERLWRSHPGPPGLRGNGYVQTDRRPVAVVMENVFQADPLSSEHVGYLQQGAGQDQGPIPAHQWLLATVSKCQASALLVVAGDARGRRGAFGTRIGLVARGAESQPRRSLQRRWIFYLDLADTVLCRYSYFLGKI